MTTEKRRILTGITTSGTPHLGNYVGAIRPAIAASRQAGNESFYFLADYHALIKCDDAARVQRSTLEIAASWLACGLDPDTVFFYRQSDIPEIPELTWLLTCVTAKGLLNRAHAYKAAVDQNTQSGEDPDAGINAGLYMYPVLMAADILIFGAHEVPVGRDQIQHIEMARDIAQRFNHVYADDLARRGARFTLPEAKIEENVATLPGEAKDPDGSNIFAIYQAFASAEETAAMRQAFADGIGWGEAKKKLFERIDAELAAPRARYEALISKPEAIEEQLLAGAKKARQRGEPFVEALRWAAGIRRLTDRTAGVDAQAAAGAGSAADQPVAKSAPPQLKSYREADGKFYFKLTGGDGAVLLQSRAFDSPKDAGRITAALIEAGGEIVTVSALLLESSANGELPATAPIAAALAQLKAEKLAKERDKKG